MPDVTTRFAPSPTGRLHIGGLRTALYNYLYAKHHGGRYLLRIEDTDRSRIVPDATEGIIAALRWAGLHVDGEPVFQSARVTRYQTVGAALAASGQAYRCVCTAERLAELREEQAQRKLPPRYDGRCRDLPPEAAAPAGATAPAVLRLKVPRHGTIAFADLIRGNVQVNAETLDDQVLLKSDGWPTYHLASVVDDHDSNVTHVIRGEEWLPSTPKHLLIYQSLGWTPPAFAHLPLLLNPDRSKLAKRTGDVAVDDYRRAGYLPEALVNFIALLGWNPGTNREIFSLSELVEHFSLQRVKRSGAVFNQEKLDWLNGYYLRHKSIAEFAALAQPWLEEARLPVVQRGDQFLQQVLTLEQPRVKRLEELAAAVEYFYRRPNVNRQLLPWQTQPAATAAQVLRDLAGFLEPVGEQDFSHPATLAATLKQFIAQRQLSQGEVLWPMRVALSGRRASPDPVAIAAVLGKAETVARLQAAAALT